MQLWLIEDIVDHAKTARRIVKVNHAGEYGAIRIYRAQLLVARLLYKDLVPFLSEVLQHEVRHCRTFRNAMPPRGARPCRIMWLWSAGGYILGLVTALMGRNMVMACTEAVEDAVHKHMNAQITFLQTHDEDLKNIIEEIKVEELQHLDYARQRVNHHALSRIVSRVIAASTETVIWLSTHGDLARMKKDLAPRGT